MWKVINDVINKIMSLKFSCWTLETESEKLMHGKYMSALGNVTFALLFCARRCLIDVLCGYLSRLLRPTQRTTIFVSACTVFFQAFSSGRNWPQDSCLLGCVYCFVVGFC